jgi:IS30 family transposase
VTCWSAATAAALVTLVERHSRYLMVLPVKDATSGTVITAVAKAFARLPGPLRKTLTWDRGSEMARHKDLAAATGLNIYFADPYAPYQRGTNENTVSVATAG